MLIHIPLTDPHPSSLQTNHLSTMLLTLLLTPVLSKSPSPRIVVVSSEVHFWLEIPLHTSHTPVADCNNPATFPATERPGFDRYKASKLFNVLLAQELARRRPDIWSCSVNPGLTVSELGQEARDGTMPVMSFSGVTARPTVEGAKSLVYCAVADKPGKNGEFYTNVREYHASDVTLGNEGEEFAGRVWRESVEIFKGLAVEFEDWVLT